MICDARLIYGRGWNSRVFICCATLRLNHPTGHSGVLLPTHPNKPSLVQRIPMSHGTAARTSRIAKFTFSHLNGSLTCNAHRLKGSIQLRRGIFSLIHESQYTVLSINARRCCMADWRKRNKMMWSVLLKL